VKRGGVGRGLWAQTVSGPLTMIVLDFTGWKATAIGRPHRKSPNP
jgi:hypothetical protein